jgi:hypothetical protein
VPPARPAGRGRRRAEAIPGAGASVVHRSPLGFIIDGAGRSFAQDVITGANTNYNPEVERRAGVSGTGATARFLAGFPARPAWASPWSPDPAVAPAVLPRAEKPAAIAPGRRIDPRWTAPVGCCADRPALKPHQEIPMARVRSIPPSELPSDLADVYERFAGGYGPFRNQVAVFAHVSAALRHLMLRRTGCGPGRCAAARRAGHRP